MQNLCLHRVGNGLAHSACQTLVGTEIYIVGAGIARPFLTVFSAVSGLAYAKDVSALSFYAFVLNRSSDHAGGQCPPLRVEIGSDQDRGNSHHGKLFYISAKIMSAPLPSP